MFGLNIFDSIASKVFGIATVSLLVAFGGLYFIHSSYKAKTERELDDLKASVATLKFSVKLQEETNKNLNKELEINQKLDDALQVLQDMADEQKTRDEIDLKNIEILRQNGLTSEEIGKVKKDEINKIFNDLSDRSSTAVVDGVSNGK